MRRLPRRPPTARSPKRRPPGTKRLRPSRADDARALAAQASSSGAVTRETADLALSNAAIAQSAAETAGIRAQTAQRSADEAQSNALLARSVADNAVTNAAVAQATADRALARTDYVAVDGTGARPTATGANAIAIGSGANAGGDSAVAIGVGATAQNGAAVSIGAGNRASGAGAVAIGENAVATRPGQIALGSAASTYTMPGIASPASVAAQSGQTGYVTSDASGNLAVGRFGPGDIAQLDFDLRRDRRDARAGVAAAAALGYAPMPSEPGRTSCVLNGALFRGEQGIGGSMAHRFGGEAPFAVTAGFAYAGNKNNIVRVGVAGES